MILFRIYHIANRTLDIIGRIFFNTADIHIKFPLQRRKLNKLITNKLIPKVAFVKQDVNDDLYCCPENSSPVSIIRSTLGRPGPVALFTKFDADFYIVETEPDPECNIWKEKWTERRWCPIEYFEKFREKVPGRKYGQKVFAVKAKTVDWGKYDIVISNDISVPERITRNYPQVVWCYYIREVTTSSYKNSHMQPIRGQDISLNQRFRPVRLSPKVMPHEIEFPYHLHYSGCFQEMCNFPFDDNNRSGIFLEHHTVADLDSTQLERLKSFGTVRSTAILPEGTVDRWEESQSRRTMDPEFMEDFMKSKYFVKCGGRAVWGTAMVEAIAMGCLVIGDPKVMPHGFIYDKYTTVSTFSDVIARISFLEKNEKIYQRVLMRQRRLVDYLCYIRPSLELFKNAQRVVAEKMKIGRNK